MRKTAIFSIALVTLVAFVVVYANHAEACCGYVIDLWDLDIVGGECDTAANINGKVYAAAWDQISSSLALTVEIKTGGGVLVRTLGDDAGEVVINNNFPPQNTWNVDDDGLVRGSAQGLVDEDPNETWTIPYTPGTNNDGDAWTDEDGDVGQFSGWNFSAVWDGTDDGGSTVPDGNYTAVVTAQVGGMNASVQQDIVTKGCCAELQAEEYSWGPGGFSFGPGTFTASNIVKFGNLGPDDAYSVSASISAVPPNVTIIDGNVSLGDIPAGGSAWSSDDFSLQVDLLNPSPPNSMMYWDVTYLDDAQRRCIIRRVPKFPGE
jgi:hypothetical protein